VITLFLLSIDELVSIQSLCIPVT